MALRFNGTSSFAQTSVIDLSSYDTITISLWLYWDLYAANNKLAFERGQSSAGYPGGFYLNPNYSAGGVASIQMFTGAASYSGVTFARPSALQWHNYVFTINRNAGTQQVTSVYIDGIAQVLTPENTSSVSTGGFGNYRWNFMSRNGTALFGAGKLAEFAAFPGVLLSQNEALALYYGIDPLELRADVKPYYWKMEGDAQLYGQDSSAQSLDFSATAVEIDNHPPIGLEYDFWNSSIENLPEADVGNLVEILAELVSRGTSQFLLDTIRSVSNEQATRLALSINGQKSSSLYSESHQRLSLQSDLSRYFNILSNIAGNLDQYSNGAKFSNLQADSQSRLALSSSMAKSSLSQSHFAIRAAIQSSLANNQQVYFVAPSNGDFTASILASYAGNFLGEGKLSLWGDIGLDGLITLDSTILGNSDIAALLNRQSPLSQDFLGRGAFGSNASKVSSLNLEQLGNIDFYPSLGVARSINLALGGNLGFQASIGVLSDLNSIFTLDSQLYSLSAKDGQLSVTKVSVADLVANLTRSSTISSTEGGSDLSLYAILPVSTDGLVIGYDISLILSRVAFSDLYVHRSDGLDLQIDQSPQCILYIGQPY